jgi:aminopeptidase YwaD
MRNLFAALLLLNFYLWSQHPDDVRIINQLCSEDFGGRGYVNSGDSLAAEFVALEFKKIGLKQQKRSFFQSFGFKVNTFPGQLVLSLNGNMLTPGKEYVINPSSPSANFTRETMVFNGKLLRIEDLFKALPELDVKNHILVLDKSLFVTRDEQVILRTVVAKLSEVLPIILLNEGTPIWHVSQNQWNHPVFEVDKAVFELGKIQAEVEAKIINHSARNVVARIKSKGKPRRRIVFTAHYDHLGRMGQNTFYPGANDNASGVTLMIAIARKLVKQPRSSTEYVFIAFAGEEVGLLGSKYFVENPMFDLKSIRFLVNLDIFGGAQHSITAVNGTIYHEEFECLVNTNKEMNVTPEIKSRGESANSDHHYFHAAGVRSFFLYSGGNNKHYHVPTDEAQDVDMVLLDKCADLMVRFVGRL